MKAFRTLFLLLLALMLAVPAMADWTDPAQNLARYTQSYAEASEGYKAISYGAESSRVQAVKEALSSLGYFPFQANQNYNRSLERAVRLFATQMRIGGDGREITPLMQAMLADAAAMPQALSPVINTNDYTADEASSGYTAYTYARLHRTSVQQGVRVGFDARITTATQSGGAWHYALQMENDPAKVVYAVYTPLPRTTVFQPGDAVTVFGTTQGTQTFAHGGMNAAALTIAADRIGYTP